EHRKSTPCLINPIYLFKGSSQIVLYCAHRGTAVSMRGLCEQEGRSGCSPPPLPRLLITALSRVAWLGSSLRASNEHCFIVRVPRAQGTNQATRLTHLNRQRAVPSHSVGSCNRR